MTAPIKKKLCWNCEGRVSHSEEHCPFCGVYIHGTLNLPNQQDDDDEERSEENPFKPDDHATIKPLYTPEGGIKLPESPVQPKTKTAAFKAPNLSLSQANKDIIPLLLLLSGAIFLLFGLAMLLFANDGVFTLQWDASWWYAYLLISIPALFFGWRFLSQSTEDSTD